MIVKRKTTVLFSDNLTKGENMRKLMFLIVKRAKISALITLTQ